MRRILLLVVLTLIGTTLVTGTSQLHQAGAQAPTVRVCEQGMLNLGQTTCYVAASGSPAEFTSQTEVISADAFLGLDGQCPVGYQGVDFADGAGLQCLREILTLQPRQFTCPAGTEQSGEVCFYPTGPVQVPCSDVASSGSPSCTPDVRVWSCDGGFATLDGAVCLADELLYVGQTPTSTIERYLSDGACITGFAGPDASGRCSRTVLRAQPDIPVCRAGVLVDFGPDFLCSSTAVASQIACADQPAQIENGLCSYNAALEEPSPVPVSTCPVGEPTPDHTRCFSNDVVMVTVPGAGAPTAACERGTVLDIGNRAVCLFEELPTVSGCDGLSVTVDLRLGQVPTEGDDVIVGTEGDDVVAALGGNDVICGMGGNDRVWGGPGNDRIFGQDGDDTLRGGPGDDTLVGEKGNDDLAGGSGNDWIWAGEGDDPAVRGGTGDDFVNAGRGNDALVNGNGGADGVVGGYGDDKVVGGPRTDLVSGGSGSDEVKGNKGADTLWGGFGVDVLLGGPQPDRLLGGADADDCNAGTTGGDPVAVENDSATGCEVVTNVP